jgi:hypothetical protein
MEHGCEDIEGLLPKCRNEWNSGFEHRRKERSLQAAGTGYFKVGSDRGVSEKSPIPAA